jgi:hypothetical protein
MRACCVPLLPAANNNSTELPRLDMLQERANLHDFWASFCWYIAVWCDEPRKKNALCWNAAQKPYYRQARGLNSLVLWRCRRLGAGRTGLALEVGGIYRKNGLKLASRAGFKIERTSRHLPETGLCRKNSRRRKLITRRQPGRNPRSGRRPAAGSNLAYRSTNQTCGRKGFACTEMQFQPTYNATDLAMQMIMRLIWHLDQRIHRWFQVITLSEL